MDDLRRIYIYSPSCGRFIAGPFQCPNVAYSVMREKQPQAGAPEVESYVLVEMAYGSVMGHQLHRQPGRRWVGHIDYLQELRTKS
jgi:hypothetical protein